MANGINPPIRGSIEKSRTFVFSFNRYQSPYKGFNRFHRHSEDSKARLYQSPYKGFNSFNKKEEEQNEESRINPPIRGSIEQDNALFKDYNHKR